MVNIAHEYKSNWTYWDVTLGSLNAGTFHMTKLETKRIYPSSTKYTVYSIDRSDVSKRPILFDHIFT